MQLGVWTRTARMTIQKQMMMKATDQAQYFGVIVTQRDVYTHSRNTAQLTSILNFSALVCAKACLCDKHDSTKQEL